MLVSNYNSTDTCPQVFTSELSINLTLITELCFTSNPHLLQVAKDNKLCDALLSIRSTYKYLFTLAYNLKILDDIDTIALIWC